MSKAQWKLALVVAGLGIVASVLVYVATNKIPALKKMQS